VVRTNSIDFFLWELAAKAEARGFRRVAVRAIRAIACTRAFKNYGEFH